MNKQSGEAILLTTGICFLICLLVDWVSPHKELVFATVAINPTPTPTETPFPLPAAPSNLIFLNNSTKGK